MADELKVSFRMRYVRDDVVWEQPPRGESDVTSYTISGDQVMSKIIEANPNPVPIDIDLGDADDDYGYLYLENVTQDSSHYINITEEASGSYAIARLYPGDFMFMQRGADSPSVGTTTAAEGQQLLVIAIDP